MDLLGSLYISIRILNNLSIDQFTS